ncbi:hypothetical protein [Aestuariivirga sp.]|uniref:hypothetical protein n=1 Tax=Aestuariivirga sp. TaxID=2650926 RepID=UPI003593A2F7
MFMIACLTTTAFAMPAWAADEVPPAVQAFLDSVERQTSVEPTYESVEQDSDGTVTITNLTIAKPAGVDEPAVTMKIGESEFSDIEDEGDGIFQIGSATFSNMTAEVKGKDFAVNVAIPEGSAEGWYVSELADNPTPQQAMRANMTSVARRMSADKWTITAMGQTYSVDGYEQTWDGDPKTGAGNFTMKVSNIAIPEAAIAMLDQGGMLKQLGYTALNFDVTSDGKVDVQGENIGYDFNFGVTGRDIATIRFGFAAADIPMSVFNELQKMQNSAETPDINALMPQLQNISISGASFRFEDASITKKVLPMIAAMQGMDEATMVASVGPMLQMGLMQLQNEAFAQQTMAAVTSFLKDPKSLTINAKPAAPVKVSDFMAINPNAPGEAITRLGVSVSAND